MKEVDTLIYSRLTSDTEATNGIVALLGSSAKILHAFELQIPAVPYLTFAVYTQISGQLSGNFTRSIELFMEFTIFSSSYADIGMRLRRLFDGYRFTVPSNYVEVGALYGKFDFEGPDGWDEALEVQVKKIRFRFFLTPKAWNPITA
jgi:hypothetical protein